MECTALVLNVNYGHNKGLMERCKTLKEYAQFIAIIRRNLASGMKHREAVEQAIDECIQNDILAEILRKNRSAIMDSILTEWDENEYREFIKEESWNEGHQVGLEDGKQIGKQIGLKSGEIIGVIRTCQEFRVSKKDTLEKIQKEFSLGKEEAEKYIKEYWK